MRPLHERMPAIIAPSHFDLWLNSRITEKNEIMGYLNSAPSCQLETFPISSRVNSPKHDDEQYINHA